MQSTQISRILAAVLAASALFLLFALIFALTLPGGDAGRITLTGSLLFSRFSFAAFYLPLYLFACSGLLLSRKFSIIRITVLVSTLIPFLTLSLFLQVVTKGIPSRAELLVLQVLGERGGAFFLLVLLLIELLVLIRLAISGDKPAESKPGQKEDKTIQEKTSPEAHPAKSGSSRLSQDFQEEFGSILNREDPAPFFADPPILDRDALFLAEDPDEDEVPDEAEDPEDNELTEDEEVSEEIEELEGVWEEDPEEDPVDPDGEEHLLPPADFLPETENYAAVVTSDGDDGFSGEENVPPAGQRQVPGLPPRGKPAPRRKVKYDVPVIDVLDEYPDGQYWIIDERTRQASDVLRHTLQEFNITAEVTGISKGPVITMFEILPAPGVKLSKITNLADNIALRLAASRVRIVAPIPGKHAVGIEVPNANRAIVSFKEMLESESRETRKMQVPVILGKDITGGARIIDLVQTPHLLIAGATGSGKSVCVNSLICSILYKRKPEEVKLILIDPKIVELKLYNGIPHLLTPVITDPKKAFKALQYAIYEMERRYSLLDALGVREIRSYNNRVKDQNLATDLLPYIVIVVDEFADLMATTGKELEAAIARLTAMSRAVGIHMVLATQRPSVDVITGLIKANIPSRIAFMVASKFDSRIIIDAVGAEKLLGKGDMLFTSAWDPNPVRIQGAFLSEEEAERVADQVKALGEPDYIDDEMFLDDDDGDDFQLTSESGEDPLFETAVGIIVEAGKASASYLQRRLKIGYNRAARLVEDMETRGIVGPANGSKPREIIHIPDRS